MNAIIHSDQKSDNYFNFMAHLFSLDSPVSQILSETGPILKTGIVDREIFESAQILGDLSRHTRDIMTLTDLILSC